MVGAVPVGTRSDSLDFARILFHQMMAFAKIAHSRDFGVIPSRLAPRSAPDCRFEFSLNPHDKAKTRESPRGRALRGQGFQPSAAWWNVDADGPRRAASMGQDAAATVKRHAREGASARNILRIRAMEAEWKAVVRRTPRRQGGFAVVRKY